MENDPFFKPLFNIKSMFSSTTDEDWDTVQSNNYISPDGSVQIQSSFKSKSWGFGSNDRPEILSGTSKPLSNFESLSQEIDNTFKQADERFNSAFKAASKSFGDMEKQMEEALGARRINPKVAGLNEFDESLVQVGWEKKKIRWAK